jgi:hypothetical protein
MPTIFNLRMLALGIPAWEFGISIFTQSETEDELKANVSKRRRGACLHPRTIELKNVVPFFMSNPKPRRLDFVVDKLSNSIEDTASGKVFDTRVIRLYPSDAVKLDPDSWLFDWRKEIELNDREVYALTTLENPDIIQGLISISDRSDHVFMNLLESAEFNVGKGKEYEGVAGNLIAYACNRSFLRGYNGALSFFAKSKLVEHYEKSLKAKRITSNRMFIDTDEALALVQRYRKSLDYHGH